MIFDLDHTPADCAFPDTCLAEIEPNGLLAIGGDLREARLLNAYRHGIFPWYSAGQPILWWSPTPRMVLFPAEFRMSRSLRKTLRNHDYQLSVDRDFDAVIRGCAAPRNAAPGTWLVTPMIQAYQGLHRAGHAHSIEVWHDQELIGGLYGMAIGRAFFGESMFSRRTDASKCALALLVELAHQQPFALIDCQVYTPHLASLGAREIERPRFEQLLQQAVDETSSPLQAIAPFPAARLLQ
ncbi:MAG: leucyl/phenylalanyl-tRNA--protein transferase [Gammaproteobacteria bacterium]|nr:leucyl/phenylalanyl-tRNA--protein transferase [Gammaproteobacteria bacterium]